MHFQHNTTLKHNKMQRTKWKTYSFCEEVHNFFYLVVEHLLPHTLRTLHKSIVGYKNLVSHFMNDLSHYRWNLLQR